uniref:Uncharacterized protein n=1 Tax=Octopus bimaculoides TaxID=37653 RepID=A0A0L8I3D7_OCTBM
MNAITRKAILLVLIRISVGQVTEQACSSNEVTEINNGYKNLTSEMFLITNFTQGFNNSLKKMSLVTNLFRIHKGFNVAPVEKSMGVKFGDRGAHSIGP